MDLAFTEEERAFAKEVRDWIAEAYTPELRAKQAMSKNGYLDKEGMVEWQKKLHARGWIAPNWPTEYGGAGFTAGQKYIFHMEMARRWHAASDADGAWHVRAGDYGVWQ